MTKRFLYISRLNCRLRPRLTVFRLRLFCGLVGRTPRFHTIFRASRVSKLLSALKKAVRYSNRFRLRSAKTLLMVELSS